MKNNEEKTPKSVIVHSIIGVAIMVLFQFLPLELTNVTHAGMQVLGIFLGTLYLWTTVETMWPSLLCIAALGLSSYATMNDILVGMLGNSTLMLMLFIMILSGALVKYKLTDYIARFFLTRKITQGKPWLFTFVICLGCFLMSAFVNPFAPIFLFWPVLNGIFAEVGYTEKDKMPKLMVMLVVVSSLVGFPVPPYMGNGLVLISNYKNITAEAAGGPVAINDAAFLIIGLAIGIIMLAVIMLACKFILRPITDLLKNYDNQKIKENPLPPLDMQQKVIAGGFVVLIILMLLPSLIPVSTGVIGYLSGLTQGLPLVIVAILAAVPYKNKKVLDVQGVISTNFSFDTYFLCAAAILLGVALTNETTGISGFLASTIGPVFGGMNIMAFTITALIICMILTNFCNSLVIAMIFENIIANVCAVNGFDARPIVTLVILFTLQCALFTPAASPFAAVLHSNKRWFSKSELYKYTFFFIVVELIVILIVGIPLSNGITSIF